MRVSAQRGAWTTQGTARWYAWDASYLALLVNFSSLASLLFLRFAESQGGFASSFYPLDRLALDASWRSLLVVLLAANTVVLDRSLAARAPRARIPFALRALLFALAALPIVGLLAWPAWQRLAGQATGGAGARLDLDGSTFGSPLARMDRGIVHARQSMGALIAWLVFGQLSPFLALLSGLAAPDPAGFAGTAVAAIAQTTFQLAGFVSAWIYAWGAERRAAKPLRHALQLALPFTFLLPGAGPLLAVLLWLPVARETREEATLVRAVHEGRHRVAALPLEPNRTERRRGLLAALAVGLLPFEAAPLGAWLARAGEAGTILGTPTVVTTAFYAVAAASLTLAAITRAGPERRRVALARALPRAMLLAAAPLVAATGIYAGSLWTGGDLHGLVEVVLLVALLGPFFLTSTAVVDYALRLPDPEGVRNGPLLLGIPSAFALLAGVAWVAKTQPDLLPVLPLSAFAARAVLVATLGRQALRPARAADLGDPRLPQSTRFALAGLTLATAAPLGGLVLPALNFLPAAWRIGIARRLIRARSKPPADPGKPDGDSAGSAQERSQLIALIRSRARLDLRGGGLWRHFDLEFSGGISSMILLVGALFGETQLWPRGYSPISLSPRLADVIGVASLAFLPVQAWLMDRYLDTKTFFPRALPTNWLAGRCLLATIPGIGLVLIPALQRLVERRPPAPPLLALDGDPGTPPPRIGRTTKCAMRYVPGLVATVSLLPLGGLSIWLAVRAPFGVAFVAFAALHLVAAFLLRRELVRKVAAEPGNSEARRERDLLPLLTLLPMPLGALPLFLLTGQRRTETLTRSVRRQSAANEPWTAALAVPTAEGLAAAGGLSFLRWKSLLVAFDALALGGAASWSVTRSDFGTAFHLRTWSGLSLLTLGSVNLPASALVAAALGLAVLVAARLARLGGRGACFERRGIPDAARAIFLTQSAVALGLVLAPFAAADRMREFVLLAVFSLAFAAIGGLFLLMPGSASFRGPGGLRHLRWLFLYLGLLAALTLLVRPLSRTGAGPALLVALALALPFLHLALYRARAIWFLRPWRRGSLSDRALPLTLRLAGGFLQATAALPLGGLLLPSAILLRAALGPHWQRRMRASPVRKS